MTDGEDTGGPTVRSYPLDTDPARPMALGWDEYVSKVRAEWSALLATDPTEPEVQRYLEIHPSMIPGGSGDVGPGGHHGSDFGVVFSQPRLTGAGRTREPDFMWVTRSTALITPILIEIEKPSKRWLTRTEHQRPCSLKLTTN